MVFTEGVGVDLEDVVGTVSPPSSRAGQVPLGFKDFPACASRCDRAAEVVGELLFDVPEDVQAELDSDLQSMVFELRAIGQRLRERAAGR